MRVIELRAENFKRLSAVRVRPNAEGVTALIGKNGAGKTSVLDAIECALGGSGRAPELPIRAGQTSAQVVLELDDLIVRRRWSAKGTSLEVTAKDGAPLRSPQAVLDRLVGALAFDPLQFGRQKPAEQAATLARIAGVDLDGYRAKRQQLFDRRTLVTRAAKDVRAAIGLMNPVPPGTPDEEVSVAAILAELKAAEQTVAGFDAAQREYSAAQLLVNRAAARIELMRRELAELEQEQERLERDKNEKAEALNTFEVIDPEPIRQRAGDADGVNKAVRAKKLRANREHEAAAKETEAEQLTRAIEDADHAFTGQLAAAPIPVPGLGLTLDGTVVINGIPFSQCSGAQRLRLSVALGLALNPQLKLMLIRDGSLLDDDGMRMLAEMAEAAGAQVLIERVDTGRDVGIRIVDGETEDAPAEPQAA